VTNVSICLGVPHASRRSEPSQLTGEIRLTLANWEVVCIGEVLSELV
jgi:hypothetical protein